MGVLQQFESVDDVPKIADHVWDDMAPFGHCVGMATQVTKALRAALKDIPVLAHYADHVHLAVGRASGEITTERQFHTLTLIHLSTHVVAIDLSIHLSAFKVPLGELFKAQDQFRFKYLESSSLALVYCIEDGNRTLIWAIPRGDEMSFEPVLDYNFVPMDAGDAVRELAFPASNELKDTEVGRLPSRKQIVSRMLYGYKPEKLPSVKYGDKYIADGCRVRIDFKECQLGVQMPYTDFLLKDSNACLLNRLQKSERFGYVGERTKDIVAYFSADLSQYTGGDGRDVEDGDVLLMNEICSLLGLPEGEVMRIARKVVDKGNNRVSA